MQAQAKTILKQYWGYDHFRPLQEEIVQAMAQGKELLALLPTGGGKSLCFQVPTMMQEGICLVITPLIALMKDQVSQLKKRGIPAEALHAGMTFRQIDITLDNAASGKIKFLYLSPERLKTDIFKERVKRMPVNRVAIDEAHCISQWGYDFRPAYLEIAELRELLPEVPFAAFTATATPKVQADIKEQLKMQNPLHFQKSFARDNLSYSVRYTEQKMQKLLEILQHVPGSAIVYTRNRKLTQELAMQLQAAGISADFYHAGLTHMQRNQRQHQWMQNATRVMVSTNAFGMGIDKPDVRVVVHWEMPDALEAYYQEAGRAGRDQQKAFAVALWGPTDKEEARKRLEMQHPEPDFLKKVYQLLANHYKIAIGAGFMQSFPFFIEPFVKQYQLPAFAAFSALKKLEEEGFVQLNAGFYQPSQANWLVDNKELYTFQIAHANYDDLIKVILRLYGGEMFTYYVNFSEAKVGQLLNLSENDLRKKLRYLQESGLIDYRPRTEAPEITFLTPRYDANKLPLNLKRLKERESVHQAQWKSIFQYLENTHRCRTQQLLEYFGEVRYALCGVCDVCVENKKKWGDDFLQLHNQIIQQLAEPHTIEELKLQLQNPRNLADVLRQMLDAGEVMQQEDGQLVRHQMA